MTDYGDASSRSRPIGLKWQKRFTYCQILFQSNHVYIFVFVVINRRYQAYNSQLCLSMHYIINSRPINSIPGDAHSNSLHDNQFSSNI
ncbi:hypothetical protein BLOT_009210 [Blomia tropicalis]|nr:hypothetical protein BLOT_009210 [Blomia tropicalis]